MNSNISLLYSLIPVDSTSLDLKQHSFHTNQLTFAKQLKDAFFEDFDLKGESFFCQIEFGAATLKLIVCLLLSLHPCREHKPKGVSYEL